MAISQPLFQTVDGTYTGADLGLPYRDLITEGVAGTASFVVSQRAAGANMSVDVSTGTAWITGDESDGQPTYRIVGDATENLSIAAADGTYSRIDLAIAEVRDSAFSGVNDDGRLRIITGTAAASPATPTAPNNAIALAAITVPAAGTAISSGAISDARTYAKIGRGPAPCRVIRTTAQSIGNGGFTAISFDSEDYDADGMHNTVTPTRITVPVSGVYRLGGAITWASNAAGIRTFHLRVNGTDVVCAEDKAAVSGSMSMTISAECYLDLGDYVELYTYQDSGGSLDVQANYTPAMWCSWAGDMRMMA